MSSEGAIAHFTVDGEILEIGGSVDGMIWC